MGEQMLVQPYNGISLNNHKKWMFETCPKWNSRTLLLFSRSVLFHSLWPHGLQHIKLPFPSPFPRAYSNSSIELVMPSNHLILCHPFLLPSIFPSIRVFSYESALCIRWAKYWSFSFSISPSKEYSGLIFFRIDWFDLLAVQGTLKSLLQQHSPKHQFFRAQPSLWSNSHIHIWLLEKP